MKLSNRIMRVSSTITLLLLFALILTEPVLPQSLKPKTVLSIEGSYFSPRRGEFKELYGKAFPVVGARLDIPLKKETSLSIKGRYLRMSEIDSLVFTNISLGLLVKRTFPENEITDFYLAAGTQFEFRRVVYNPLQRDSFGTIIKGLTFDQEEVTLSFAVESGVDVWILSGIKLSPNVGFNYFPFGDPTTGDFGDTGGFMFSVSLGFRL